MASIVDLWNRWKQAESKSGADLAVHLESGAPALDQAIQKVRQQAQSELQKKQDLWQPVAQALAEWLPGARKMQSELDAVGSLKSAEDWLRTTALKIHNERFEPIKERVRRIWELLRTRSHVQLEDVTFQGKSTARRVNLEVTVDGTRGAALGVMSQGELHSLALSLFLPRATLESSPFRFVFIDDPVQSMDPARVDGLARVLELASKKRQVVIFTHDDRLPEAIRRLQIPANVLECFVAISRSLNFARCGARCGSIWMMRSRLLERRTRSRSCWIAWCRVMPAEHRSSMHRSREAPSSSKRKTSRRD
jgi:hypothetical protein